MYQNFLENLREFIFFTKGQRGSETHALRVFIRTQMPTPKSIDWNFYQKVVDKDEKVYYKCNYCGKSYKSNTTRQENHLENCLKKDKYCGANLKKVRFD